jgi:hypothetical protein
MWYIDIKSFKIGYYLSKNYIKCKTNVYKPIVMYIAICSNFFRLKKKLKFQKISY